MNSDEDDEEPQNEPGTSSTSQPTVPVLPYYQGPAATFQGPAVLDNSADEDSECSEMNIVHNDRTPEALDNDNGNTQVRSGSRTILLRDY